MRTKSRRGKWVAPANWEELGLDFDVSPSGDRPSTRSLLRRYGPVVAKIFVSIAVLLFLGNKLDIPSALALAGNLAYGPLAIAVLILGFQMLTHVWVWRAVGSAVGISLPPATTARTLLLSLFFNQGLPAALGGMGARVYFTWRENVPMADAIGATVIERAVFLAGLLVLGLITLPAFPTANSDLAIAYVGLFLGSSVVGILLVGVVWFLNHRGRLADTGPMAKIAAVFSRAADGRRQIVAAFLLMMLYHFASIATFALIVGAAGIEVETLTLVVLIPHVLLASALPISLNGWGVREISMVAAFGIIGVPAEQAVVVSMMFGLGVLVTRLPMGLLWFRQAPSVK
jgi:glycosyltransferase 2 family protein